MREYLIQGTTIEALISQGYDPEQVEFYRLLFLNINMAYKQGQAGKPFNLITVEGAIKYLETGDDAVSDELQACIVYTVEACLSAYNQGRKETNRLMPAGNTL